MSGLVNKVKDVLHPEKTTTTTTTTTTQRAGHHSTHNPAEPRTVGTTAGHHDGSYTTSDNYAYGTDGPATRTDGPHKSNLMNKADPRVDSDRDYSKNAGMNPQGNASTNTHTTSGLGTTGTHGAATHTNAPLGTTGTHAHTGHTDTTGTHVPTGTHAHTAHTGTTGTAGTYAPTNTHAHTGTTGHTGNVPEGTFGPHNSRIANAADPRVDSDLDANRNATYNTTGHSTAATGAPYNTTGHTTATTGAPVHSNHTANVVDPRVNTAGTTHTGTHTGPHTTTHATPHTTTHAGHTGGLGTTGNTVVGGPHTTGPAPTTAGPHRSDLANKVDPRVDSDLNGSKTYGGDKTFAQDNFAYRDPNDATQVPPSVMQKHKGAPTVAHGNDVNDHVRRNSVSHQAEHRGL